MENNKISPIYCLALFILLLAVKEAYSAKCTCGEPILQRVVGGQEANVEDYPWLIAIQVKKKDGWKYDCVGALIHPEWVLTAAHCVQTRLRGGLVYKKKCFSAYYHQVTCYLRPKDIELALASTQGTKREFTVSRVIPHPKYKRGEFAYDIALLKLMKPTECGKSVALICLSEGEQMDFPNKPVTLAGWGQTDGNVSGKSARLRETKLQVMPKNQCAASKQLPGVLCTLGKDFGGTPCKGDSGGPLMYNDGGMYYVTGVVSHGSKNCHITKQVMFTQVTPYMDFIRKHVKIDEVPKAIQKP